MPVKPGKTYWVQVDGSGGGTEGDFTLTLSDLTTTSAAPISQSHNIIIYPVPVENILNIKRDFQYSETMELKIFSVTGKLLMQRIIDAPNGNELSIDISALSKGVYLIKFIEGNNTQTLKFVKN
ncbi:MAG: T9SS type A sorting domain-containing protein [Bacteroidales bacterium]|nr:T9SS type A sorting domain-containing protein [Bacteroidales bacterium]